MILGRNDKEDTMSNPVRKKLDELKELRQEDYITEEEYAAARGNALLDAGFDIVPRTGLEARFRRAPLPEGKSEEKKNGGCGCFLILLLLIVILFGGRAGDSRTWGRPIRSSMNSRRVRRAS